MSKKKIKLLLVLIAGLIPITCLRNLFYKKILKYKIGKKAKIGFLNFVYAEKVSLASEAKLMGIFNFVYNINHLILEPYSKMGCPLLGVNFISGNGSSKFHIKRAARITWGHFFDLSDNITIGERTIVGGKSCEFFTHDIFNGKRLAPIEIGNGCYIGSSCKFCMGTKIADNTVVGMGSVITKKFEQPGVLLGGVPAKQIKENCGYDAKITYDNLGHPY